MELCVGGERTGGWEESSSRRQASKEEGKQRRKNQLPSSPDSGGSASLGSSLEGSYPFPSIKSIKRPLCLMARYVKVTAFLLELSSFIKLNVENLDDTEGRRWGWGGQFYIFSNILWSFMPLCSTPPQLSLSHAPTCTRYLWAALNMPIGHKNIEYVTCFSNL